MFQTEMVTTHKGLLIYQYAPSALETLVKDAGPIGDIHVFWTMDEDLSRIMMAFFALFLRCKDLLVIDFPMTTLDTQLR